MREIRDCFRVENNNDLISGWKISEDIRMVEDVQGLLAVLLR